MQADHNLHLQRLDKLTKARKLWLESEYRLDFLRTETGKEPKQPADDKLLEWYLQTHN
jgi:hypothetical protein